jgi:hypothetical protein
MSNPMVVSAIACGTVGAAVSYFLLKRKSAVDLLGTDLAEWQADGLLLAVGSVTGDLIGAYAVPYVEKQVVGNDALRQFLDYGLPPSIMGAQHYVIKKYGTDSNQTPGSELLLAAGTKFVVDRAREKLAM